MATILDPEEGDRIFDPACGSGGLLIKAQLRLRDKVAAAKGVSPGQIKMSGLARPLQLCGQEINADTYAIARMNAIIHDMEADIRHDDTMVNPRFVDEAEEQRREADEKLDTVLTTLGFAGWRAG